ncbi:MAG TPA: formylglycine-generating enzyme family protein [Kofleriaceae bacterium]|jgi:formylglycine-generating enzyme required for sulfatase activity|nr:formylglycine-generating enzyme family protein [Kofleriaceae bacterium]
MEMGCGFPRLPALVGRDANVDTLVDATATGPPNQTPDGQTEPIPSECLTLPATCGAAGNDNCCASLPVPAGTYFRSYDTAGDTGSGDQSSPATVSRFRLDKYDVTVGRFRAFVMAGQGTQSNPPSPGGGAHAQIPGSGWDASWNASLVADKATLVSAMQCDSQLSTWDAAAGSHDTLPINCITWYEAMAFCAWDGGYLPTEAEWNDAATGGGDSQGQRAYPWGNQVPDDTRANYHCRGDGDTQTCKAGDILPVGSKSAGDGRWGQSDLAANMSNWLLDYYAPYNSPCSDCAEITSGTNRIQRGGSFGDDVTGIRTAYRNAAVPTTRYYFIGFRCARAP